jgi:hypothetical protein
MSVGVDAAPLLVLVLMMAMEAMEGVTMVMMMMMATTTQACKRVHFRLI